MIIRIIGEGQFRVPGELHDKLNEMDNRIVDYVAKGQEEEFKKELAKLVATIREKGTYMEAEEIIESDVIVPPEDLTLAEAKDVFTGTGIFED